MPIIFETGFGESAPAKTVGCAAAANERPAVAAIKSLRERAGFEGSEFIFMLGIAATELREAQGVRSAC
jgi:hypothetical protein